uniref:C-type lectin domain-containing protein n=1 Tax=Paramormyrops kingsleyae TaxID=1676925 RepID=A0A3B3QXU9_9TELE
MHCFQTRVLITHWGQWYLTPVLQVPEDPRSCTVSINLFFTAEHRCPLGWKSFNSKCYYISDKKKSWVDSQMDCRQRGADLVVIDSKEEQIFLSRFRGTWIGLTDRKHEGTWKWVDGTPLTTSYWAPGEPNDARKEEDCAEIHSEHDTLKNWNDGPCSAERNWICERGGFN